MIKLQPNNQLQTALLAIASTKPLKKGAFLFAEGDVAKDIYLVQSGKIKLGKVTDDGKELSFRLCAKHDILGDLTLFTDNTRHFLHAKMMTSGTVAVINKKTLEKKLVNNPELLIEFTKIMNLLIRRDQTLFRDLILYGKKGALCSTLIRLTNSYSQETEDGYVLTVALTNQELADYCGTTRESVNRLLSELRKKQVISMQNGFIVIHEMDYLRNAVKCEYCPVELCTLH